MKINFSNVAKCAGFLGAVFSGVAMMMSGDMVNGLGIIAASLSSASIVASGD
jgi:hypothetical protein